jgi:O-antigen/teichoic acid export membrane protein
MGLKNAASLPNSATTAAPDLLLRLGLFRFASFGMSRILAILKVIIFARIFQPEVLGTIGLIHAIVRLIHISGDTGFWRAIISSPKNNATISPIFTISLLHAGFVALLVMLLAPIANWFGYPELVTPIRYVAFAAGTVVLQLPVFLAEREMNYGKFAGYRQGQEVLEIGSTIFLEYLFGLGLWSAIYGYAGSFAVIGIASWAISGLRVQLALDFVKSRAIYSNGLPYAMSEYLAWIIDRGDNLVVAYFYGPRAFAFYTLAWHLPKTLSLFGQAVEEHLFVAFAQAGLDKPGQITVLTRINRGWSELSALGGFGLLLYSSTIVEVLFGAQWVDSLPLLRMMSVAFLIQNFWGCGVRGTLLAHGRTSALMRLTLLTALTIVFIGAPLIWIYGPLGGAVFWVGHALVIPPILSLLVLMPVLGSMRYLVYTMQCYGSAFVCGTMTVLIFGIPQGEILAECKSLIFFLVTSFLAYSLRRRRYVLEN